MMVDSAEPSAAAAAAAATAKSLGKTTDEGGQRRSRRNTRKHRKPKIRDLPGLTGLIFHPVFLGLFGLLGLALAISFWLVLVHPDMDEMRQNPVVESVEHHASEEHIPILALSDAAASAESVALVDGPHLTPRLPHLPIFPEIPNAEQLIEDTLQNQKPTISGIAAILYRFLAELHEKNLQHAQEKEEVPGLIQNYFDLAQKHLSPLRRAYQGESIFPVRDDGSIYVSLAAFREHLLGQTLKSAFDQAKNPHKLFIGAIVQNCFGNDGRQCRTGLQVVGKNAQGKDQTKQFDAPPDENGVETFCQDEKYQPYCANGQIRVIYIHDTDALGPAVARYYASKLWGGETYFLQMDSHLEFAPDWDSKYIAEVRATKNYPKSVLSAYPPGFQDFGQYQGGTPGSRLCTCQFSSNGVESHIIRINTGMRCKGDEPRPTQIAFIAAGFFFARAEFLTDVPFDPFVPWCFMGEEIALSMRAWTQGWDIYAPRQNLIAHQYRPGRLGLPKFWESVGRDSHRPNLNTRLQQHVIRRIKHMVGYSTDTVEAIEADGDGVVLTDYDLFALGTNRTREAYLELTNIDVENQQCHAMHWCNHGELE